MTLLLIIAASGTCGVIVGWVAHWAKTATDPANARAEVDQP